jgi:hypothetical protein
MTEIKPEMINENYYMLAGEKERRKFRDWLNGMMKVQPIYVTFTKSDGSKREMRCSLREQDLVAYEKKTDLIKEKNDDVCAVWDLDKSAWRSFRYDSIREIRVELSDK